MPFLLCLSFSILDICINFNCNLSQLSYIFVFRAVSTASIPSLFGIFVYRECTSMVTRMLFSGFFHVAYIIYKICIYILYILYICLYAFFVMPKFSRFRNLHLSSSVIIYHNYRIPCLEYLCIGNAHPWLQGCYFQDFSMLSIYIYIYIIYIYIYAYIPFFLCLSFPVLDICI